MARIDRPYCANDMFKQFVLDNATSSEAECRLSLSERLRHCNGEACPQCVSPCNYEWARVAGAVVKCVDRKRHYGYVHYTHTSDAGILTQLRTRVCSPLRAHKSPNLTSAHARVFSGQLARSLHGAVRKTNYIAVPEKLAAHNYAIGHQNPTGLLQRDALSCRFKHRNSPVPHFAPGFDDDGMPVAREGYHVPCRKHSDCYKCGRHPLTGQVRLPSASPVRRPALTLPVSVRSALRLPEETRALRHRLHDEQGRGVLPQPHGRQRQRVRHQHGGRGHQRQVRRLRRPRRTLVNRTRSPPTQSPTLPTQPDLAHVHRRL